MLAVDTEAQILALARSEREVDRRAASDQLVGALSQPLYRLCLHLTGNSADAEDAVQDTLLSACRAVPRFRGESKLSTWVYRIALRAALEVKSRRVRRSETSTDELKSHAVPGTSADDHVELQQRAARLHAAMEMLAPEQRAVLSLFAVDGLGHQQIADVLGIPEGTVWSRLHTARKKVAAALG